MTSKAYAKTEWTARRQLWLKVRSYQARRTMRELARYYAQTRGWNPSYTDPLTF